MTWNFVSTTKELERLDYSNCWQDSHVVEICSSRGIKSYFPNDINFSGTDHLNLHVLVDADSPEGSHLELVFVSCSKFSPLLSISHLSGFVDTLKRVEIQNSKGEAEISCSRLLYRYVEVEEPFSSYFYEHLVTEKPNKS